LEDYHATDFQSRKLFTLNVLYPEIGISYAIAFTKIEGSQIIYY